nr:putative late blight resistance protein homolog R1B-14 [Ipomoea batatas]
MGRLVDHRVVGRSVDHCVEKKSINHRVERRSVDHRVEGRSTTVWKEGQSTIEWWEGGRKVSRPPDGRKVSMPPGRRKVSQPPRGRNVNQPLGGKKLSLLGFVALASGNLKAETWKFLLIQSSTLKLWEVANSYHFPKLERLVLKHCFSLKEIPNEIGDIPTLEFIELRHSPAVEHCARKIEDEQRDFGNDSFKVYINRSSVIS